MVANFTMLSSLARLDCENDHGEQHCESKIESENKGQKNESAEQGGVIESHQVKSNRAEKGCKGLAAREENRQQNDQ